ncbi:membrane hypothetical protein [Magnetospirillum sp. LM-5]|nr:membrane hypothetical protein [Magnetospirillum sp. LM-5]
MIERFPVSPWLPIVIASILVTYAFWRGIQQKRHRLLDGGAVGWIIEAFAIVLSDMVYRGGNNYVALTEVRDSLYQSGLDFLKWKEGYHPEPELVDQALKVAATLPIEKAIVSRHSFTQHDNGIIDYIKFSFRLFGKNILSLYLGYYLIFSAAVVAGCVAFFDTPWVLWVMVTALVGFVLMLDKTTIMGGTEIVSENNQRFLSTFAMIPSLHGMAISMIDMAATPLQIGLVVVQALILHLAVSSRPTSNWMVLPAVMVWAAGLYSSPLPLPDALWNGGGWAIPLMIAVVIAVEWRRRDRMHRVYYSDYATNTYMRWHGAYLGFTLDEGTWNANRLPNQAPVRNDENGVFAVRAWVEADPARACDLQEPDKMFCPFQLGARWGLYGRLIKEVCLEYMRKNRHTLLRLYLILKPRSFIQVMGEVLKPLWAMPAPRHLIVLAALVVAVIGVVATLPAAMVPLVGLMAVAMLACMPLPQIWAYSIAHGLVDNVWTTLFAFPLIVSLAIIVAMT